MRADRLAVALAARRGPTMRDVRVAGEQADQLRADVAGGADDRRPGSGRRRGARPAAGAVPGTGWSRGRSAAIAAPVEPALTGALGRSRAAGSTGVGDRAERRHRHDYTVLTA